MPKKFKFGGGNKCMVCNKTVYVQEQVAYEGKFLHEACFKCSICKKTIHSANHAGSMDGKVFHRKCSHDLMLASGGKYGGVAVKNKAQREASGAASPKAADDGKAAAAADAKASEAKATKAAATKAKAEKAAADKAAADKAAADKAAADKAAADKAAADKAADKAAADKAASDAKAAPAPAAEEKTDDGIKAVYEGGNRKIWFLENIDKKKAMTITEPIILRPDVADTVYLGKIIGASGPVVVMIETKCKAVTISSCKHIAVVCQDVVARIEVMNTSKLQCQISGSVPIVQVDKTDQTTFYLSEACQALEPSTLIYSSGCTGVNIIAPHPTDPEGDQVECPIPEQVKSFVDENNKMQNTIIVAGEAE